VTVRGAKANVLMFMRHRRSTAMRDLRGQSNITEAEMEDLVDEGYLTVTTRGASGNRTWVITRKGQRWVDSQLD
jgi:predicted transcriptional regulator